MRSQGEDGTRHRIDKMPTACMPAPRAALVHPLMSGRDDSREESGVQDRERGRRRMVGQKRLRELPPQARCGACADGEHIKDYREDEAESILLLGYQASHL